MEVYGVSDSTSSSVFTIQIDSTCCCLLWNCTLWSTSFLELTYSVTSYTAKRDTEIFSDRIKSLTTPLYWSETQNTSLTVTQPPHTVTIGSRDSIFFSTTVSFLSQQKSDLIYAGKIIFRMKYIWQINLTHPTVERAVRAADLTNAGLLGLIAVFSRETCNDWQVSAWRAIFSWLPQGFRLALWLFLPMGTLMKMPSLFHWALKCFSLDILGTLITQLCSIFTAVKALSYFLTRWTYGQPVAACLHITN